MVGFGLNLHPSSWFGLHLRLQDGFCYAVATTGWVWLSVHLHPPWLDLVDICVHRMDFTSASRLGLAYSMYICIHQIGLVYICILCILLSFPVPVGSTRGQGERRTSSPRTARQRGIRGWRGNSRVRDVKFRNIFSNPGEKCWCPECVKVRDVRKVSVPGMWEKWLCPGCDKSFSVRDVTNRNFVSEHSCKDRGMLDRRRHLHFLNLKEFWCVSFVLPIWPDKVLSV